jgi:FkbM family methyltransferase
MSELMKLARRVRMTCGGDAVWDAVRPGYWALVSRLSSKSGVAMSLPDGHHYRLDGHLYAWQPETYETEVMAVLLPAISPDTIVYDIGAHVGLVTLMAAHRVDGGVGHVYAFEPSPGNFVTLTRHLEWNACHGHATAVQALVGDRCQVDVPFWYRAGEFTANSLAYRADEDHCAHLRMLTIDDFVARGEGPAPQVMKVDVEGFEHAVLRGARRVLADFSPTIVCALHPQPLALLGTSADAVIADMAAWGYRAWNLRGSEVRTAGFEEVVFRKE